MKKLFTLVFIANFTFTIQAQDITNTLGAGGNFEINKNDGTNFLRVNQFGNLNLGGGPGSSYLNGGRDLNLVKEGGSAGITLTAISNGANSRARIDFAKANGTIGALSTLVDNDEVSYLSFYGHDGAGYHFGASLKVSVDGNVTPGIIPMQFDFINKDSESSLTIKADGKVGIGSETPASTLEVNGSISKAVTINVGDTYTADADDYTIIPQNTIGDITLTLPAPSSCRGRIYVVKHDGNAANNINIGSSTTIDGHTTITLDTAWESVTFQSTGATWIIIGGIGYTGS